MRVSRLASRDTSSMQFARVYRYTPYTFLKYKTAPAGGRGGEGDTINWSRGERSDRYDETLETRVKTKDTRTERIPMRTLTLIKRLIRN